MVVLDNLVVSTALPVIRVDLGASIEQLEWTVNAYTLTFAVFLLHGRSARRPLRPAPALPDRARASSRPPPPRAALAPSIEFADRRPGAPGRRRSDRHAADADDPQRRPSRPNGAASRSARGPASPASRSRSGPLVGGAVVEGISWQWIFWLNVPDRLVAAPAGAAPARELRPGRRLDLPGLGLVSVGLLGIVWGLVNGNGDGWGSPRSSAALVGGVALLVAFVGWERATPSRCCRCASSATALRGRERRVAAHVLRHVRLDLPARAVPPDRAGLLAARGRPATSCRGRRCRCSSRRSPARCPTASADGR